jgi:hypothetical protein
MLQVVAIVIGALVIVGFIALWWFVSGARKRTSGEVRQRLGGADVVLLDGEAHCYGLESKDHTHLSTFGALGMSADKLLYVQWSPREEFELDRSKILGVEVSREFRGRDRDEDLLTITFQGETGEDKVAWKLTDNDSWLKELAPAS